MAEAVVIDRICIWGVNDSAATAITNVSLEWLSTLGTTVELTASGTNARPAHISSAPPDKSLASFWTSVSSTLSEQLMTITGPDGMIVDVHVTFVLADGGPFNPITVTNPGGVYVGYTDLDQSGSNFLQPVGRYRIAS